MTKIADIVTNALLYIDDIRLQKMLEQSPALLYRRMWMYVQNAAPLLSRPPELAAYISGRMVAPEFNDAEWVSDAESMTRETVISGFPGYDVCSVCLRSAGGTKWRPYSEAVYNAETGEVTMPAQPGEGLVYQIDFYADGEVADLTAAQMRLFGLAVACVWDERFTRNWLNMQPKIKDASFETVNEANYMGKATERLMLNRQRLSDELRKYEQDLNYNATVPTSRRIQDFA